MFRTEVETIKHRSTYGNRQLHRGLSGPRARYADLVNSYWIQGIRPLISGEFIKPSTTCPINLLDTTRRGYNLEDLYQNLGLIAPRNQITKKFETSDSKRTSTRAPEDHYIDVWDQYLKDHRDELIAQYKGKFVAIFENKVYASDKDLPTLAKRVYAELGYRPILMTHIDEHTGESKNVAEFLSPVQIR